MDARTFSRIASLSVGSLSETSTYLQSVKSLLTHPGTLTLCGDPDILSL